MEAESVGGSTCLVNHLKGTHQLSKSLLKLSLDNLPRARNGGDLHWELSPGMCPSSRPTASLEASMRSHTGEHVAGGPAIHACGSQPYPSSELEKDLLELMSGSLCDEEGSPSEAESDEAERTASVKPAAPAHHYMQPIQARRQSLPTLLAKMGPACDLGIGEDGLTTPSRREQSQIERAREAVRDMLIARELLDPRLGFKPPVLPYQEPHQPQPSLQQQQQQQQQQQHRQHTPLSPTALSSVSGPATAVRRHRRLSQPELFYPSSSTCSGAAAAVSFNGSPPLPPPPGATARTSASLAAPSVMGVAACPSVSPRQQSSPTSAPSSPMAAAAARRRQSTLDAHAVVASGMALSYGSTGGGASLHSHWTAYGGGDPPSPHRTHGGTSCGHGCVGGSAAAAAIGVDRVGWQRRSATGGCSRGGVSTLSSITPPRGAGSIISGFDGGVDVGGVGTGLARLRAASCTVGCGEALAALRLRLGMGAATAAAPGPAAPGTSAAAASAGRSTGAPGRVAAVMTGSTATSARVTGCGSDMEEEEEEEKQQQQQQLAYGEDVEAPEGNEGGGLHGWEEGEDDEDGHAVDLETLVRSERRRLNLVKSKVTTMLRSQQRCQGLLAHTPGCPRAPLALTAEELTASVIPTPAKPPEGVDLKVPADDIRFSGVRLRFLMGLLEALDAHPALASSTSDLVAHLVLPLTSDHKCRLLDLIPPQHRGQPHHYICHAWPCSARELLHTLRREMLPSPPPRPPPPMGSGGGAGAGGGGEGAVGRIAAVQQRDSRRLGGVSVGGVDGYASSVRRGVAAGGGHLPHLGFVGGGTGCGPAAAETLMAAQDADAGAGRARTPAIFLPTIAVAAVGGGGAASGGGGGGAERGGLPSPSSPSSAPAPAPGTEAAWRQLYEAYKTDLHQALDQVVWIDLVCVNQHNLVKKDYGKIAKTVVGCGSTVLVLDTHLTALSRTWCLFEIMHCLRCKRHLKVFRAQPPPPLPPPAAAPPPPTAASHRHPPALSKQPTMPQASQRQRQPRQLSQRVPGRCDTEGPDGLGGSGAGAGGAGAGGGDRDLLGCGLGGSAEEARWDRAVETISIDDSRATCEADRVGILQEVLSTVGTAYVNDLIRGALRLSNAERAGQLAVRREQLRTTVSLLQPDPHIIGTEEYGNNLARCREHLTSVLEQFYPDDMLRCIIPSDYVSDSARCWDMLGIFAEILDREQFRADAKVLRSMAWLIFKRHSKRYIEVLYEKELENWMADSLEHDRKWRRTQAKLKHDAQKNLKWNLTT